MALLTCPECGSKVSSFAECCPKCGCPIRMVLDANKPFVQIEPKQSEIQAKHKQIKPKKPVKTEKPNKTEKPGKTEAGEKPKLTRKYFSASVADRVKECQLKAMAVSDEEYFVGVDYYKNNEVCDFSMGTVGYYFCITGTINGQTIRLALDKDEVMDRYTVSDGGYNGTLCLSLLNGKEVALILYYLKKVYSNDDYESPVPLKIRGVESRETSVTQRKTKVPPQEKQAYGSSADYEGMGTELPDEEDDPEVDPEEIDTSTEMDDYDADGCPKEYHNPNDPDAHSEDEVVGDYYDSDDDNR
jgi:hypothetical protein